MQDDYDDKFKDIDFNCSLVSSLKWAFFNTGVNKPAERKILHHLLQCPSCRKVYEQYAREIGWGTFNAIEYAMKFLKDNDKTITLSEPKPDTIVDDVLNEKIIKVSRYKCMREILLSNEDEAFQKYLMVNLAKNLEFLNKCYNLEEANQNEKS